MIRVECNNDYFRGKVLFVSSLEWSNNGSIIGPNGYVVSQKSFY